MRLAVTLDATAPTAQPLAAGARTHETYAMANLAGDTLHHHEPEPSRGANAVIPSHPAPPTLDVPAAPVDVVTSSAGLALKGLFVLASLYTFYFAREVLLPVVLAILLALVLYPAVRALKRIAVPEPIGAALVVLAVLACIALGIVRLFEPASEWLAQMPQVAGKVERKLHALRKSVAKVSKAAERVEQMTKVSPQPTAAPPPAPPSNGDVLNRILGATKTLLVSAASTTILLYFLLASGDMFLRKLVRVLDTFEDKKRAVGFAHAIQTDMARYLFTITCINTGLGAIVGAAMYLLGMPNPVLWAVLVAVFNYLPYVGAATNLGILTVVAFLTFDDLQHVLLVPGVYLVIEIVEGQVVTPILTGRSLTLNPVMIFLAMLFWTWLWGVVGALMAVPLLMTLKIVCDHVESLQPVGEFLSGKHAPVD
jgi:predicted PurR-regulated permease PerM